MRPSEEKRRDVRIVVGATALSALVILAVVFATKFIEWRQAVERYEDAVAVQDVALSAWQSASASFDDANDSLTVRSELVERLLELEGTFVPSSAVAALLGSRDELLIDPGTRPAVALAAREDDPSALSVLELDEATRRIGVETTKLESGTRMCLDFVDLATDSAASFDLELDVVIGVLLSRGEKLLSERADASADALEALGSANTALSRATVVSTPEVLDRWVHSATNVVRTSNAKRIDDPNSVVVVVNKRRPLQPQGYVPKLVRVNVPHISTPLLRVEAVEPLVQMFAAFNKETGEQLRLQNSYRSYATQTNTYAYHVSTKGQAQADRGSARPGHSEHQTGLALDVNGVGHGCSIRQCFGDMVHGKWLEKNAWRFGWIIRYPKGFEHVTGYDWEPWHLRYVGVEVSTEMHERGILTLEEYFGLEPAPTY